MLLRSGLRVAAQEEAGRATLRRRRRARPPDQLAGFSEDILQEILVRLPPKSVLRCRAVCRLWRRLASDPAFLLDHHRRQPELALISSYRTSAGEYPRLEALHLRGAEFRPLFGFPELFRFPLAVDGSCDGLFIAGHYICNPATRQSAPLSPNRKLHVFDKLIGLFKHQPSGEYRVLYRRNLPYALSSLTWHVIRCPHEYRVLAVGTDKSWRVDCPLEVIAERAVISGAPVLLNGSLHIHWRRELGVRSVRYHKILVFDTTAETFRQMNPPAVSPHHAMRLLDMGGQLAASISKDDATAMSIFMLHKGDVWAFRYRIKVPVMDLKKRFREEQQGDWWAKVVSEEGDVLVSCYGQLLHCDKGGNLMASFKYDDDMPVVVPHRLQESLIQHTFFLKKN